MLATVARCVATSASTEGGQSLTLSRRFAVCGALCFALPPALRPGDAVAVDTTRLERYSTSIRGPGDAGLSAWGEAWSNSCSWYSTPETPSSSAAAALPKWLQGKWQVTSSLDDVSFPIGRKFAWNDIPGKRMVSILPLPNIGNTPSFEVEYASAIEAQRGANAKSTLEAFWPAAKVVDISAPASGMLRLRYSSPTRSKANVEQSVSVALCASEGGLLGEDQYMLSEVFQQDNLEQGTRGEYQILTQFTRDAGGNGVRAKQRVAAFLQPTDGQYFDAQGKPVALYDYSYRYTRLADAP